MSAKCPTCGKTVYFAEEAKAAGKSYHKRCLKCAQCNKALDTGSVCDREEKIYCKACYSSIVGLKGFRGDGYAGSTLACVSGGAAKKVEYASGTIETESALSKGFSGYRQVGDAGVAGPTSAHVTTVMTEDTGRYVSSGRDTGGYRQVGDAGVAGALSAHSTTVMTEDTGKYSGAGRSTGGYRQVGDAGAAGALSAHSTTVMTEDTGKYAGAGRSTGGYRQVGDAGAAGALSAHTTTVMTEDIGKYAGTGDVSSAKRFCSSCGTKATGGRFCPSCGKQI